jgi:hypothetical protein
MTLSRLIKVVKSYQVTQASTTEIISVADLKEFMRIDGNDEDDLIALFRNTAISMIEKDLNYYVFGETQFNLWLDAPDEYEAAMSRGGQRVTALSEVMRYLNFIEIIKRPLKSVESIKYYGQDDNEYEYSSDYYRVDTLSLLPRVVLTQTSTWPSDIRNSKGIAIAFTAGEDDAANIPADLINAVKMLANYLYENRGCDMSSMTGLPSMIASLISSYRYYEI